MEDYPSKVAVKVSGVPYPRLDYWARSGFLPPSRVIGKEKGRGSERRYNFQDLLALRVAGDLREEGISLQKLREVVRFLQKFHGKEEAFSSSRLVVIGKDVALRHGDRLIMTVKEPGQTLLTFVLNLGPITKEVRRDTQKTIRRLA